MTKKLSLVHCTKLSVFVILTLALAGCAGYGTSPGQADAQFTAVEVEGQKIWQGGGTVDLKGRDSLTLKVTNTLAADHGFSIDTMKVQDVIKAGESKTITVPRGNIDTMVTEHRVYCQIHPKHVAATLRVINP
jgi:hypothetical protein